jgi:hypothetical protein
MKIGQKFIYTKGVDLSDPPTKQVKVKDNEGKSYTISRPTEQIFVEQLCEIIDVITTNTESTGISDVSYKVQFEFSKSEKRIFVLPEHSLMWADMKEVN